MLEQDKRKKTKRDPEEYLDWLLSRGAYSKKDLERRLLKRGCSFQEAGKLLEVREKLGFIDDLIYARLFVEGRPDWSIRRLMDGLREKGIERDKAQEVLDQEDIDELERARALAENWLEMALEDRKILGRLERRGFSRSTAFQALKEAKTDKDKL